MREARYRFTDAVRATTRAIALRMVHAGEVADSPDALAAWIERTDDIRGNLTAAGYGEKFTAEDLFPLFQAHVAKASRLTPQTAAPTPSPARSKNWIWVFTAAVILAIVIVLYGVVAT